MQVSPSGRFAAAIVSKVAPGVYSSTMHSRLGVMLDGCWSIAAMKRLRGNGDSLNGDLLDLL